MKFHIFSCFHHLDTLGLGLRIHLSQGSLAMAASNRCACLTNGTCLVGHQVKNTIYGIRMTEERKSSEV